MSQWGAKAMGDQGADYTGILAHYYGGLTPQPGAAYLPDEVAVGLDWGEQSVAVSIGGGFRLVLPSGRSRAYRDGTWKFEAGVPGVTVDPPDALSLPSMPRGLALR
jgi:hypothetical protein